MTFILLPNEGHVTVSRCVKISTQIGFVVYSTRDYEQEEDFVADRVARIMFGFCCSNPLLDGVCTRYLYEVCVSADGSRGTSMWAASREEFKAWCLC